MGCEFSRFFFCLFTVGIVCPSCTNVSGPSPTQGPTTIGPTTQAPMSMPQGLRTRFLNEERYDDLLFALIPNTNDRQSYIANYRIEKDNMIVECYHPTSYYHNHMSTYEECFDDRNQMDSSTTTTTSSSLMDDKKSKNLPWMVPNDDYDSVMVASNPGIWKFENFVTEEQVQQLLDIMYRYGQGEGGDGQDDAMNNKNSMFGPCSYEDDNSIEGQKFCMNVSPTQVCQGHSHYTTPHCVANQKSNDQFLVQHILSKLQMIWSSSNNNNINYEVPYSTMDPDPFVQFQLTKGGTLPVDFHPDMDSRMTVVLYLTNGGAKTIFPHANLTITPQMGNAYMWLNIDPKGNMNPMSFHGVQAHPVDAEDRVTLVMIFPFEF